MRTEDVQIKVKSLLTEKGDEGGLRSLKPIFTFRSYLWVWILLGLAALIAGGYFILKWRKSKAGPVSTEPPKPAEEVAWTALEALEHSDLLALGKIKEYYTELLTILRRYLEDRFGISAMERTTAELMQEARRLDLSSELSLKLRDIFENGDLVKFAKFTPDQNDIAADLNRARSLVAETTPVQKKEAEAIPV